MRLLQLDRLELLGGDRACELRPGLNIVYGPIATGKSTLVKLLRALFGSIPDDLPPEVSQNVSSLRAAATVGDGAYHILRRLVTTDTALVEVVGDRQALLLPASKPTPAHLQTYSDWLLDTLRIPNIRVPAAPSRPESEPTPVTFTDFLNYCVLRGHEIDNCVFGHTQPYRDIKRRYVFEIVYGLYDESVARLQTRLRGIENQLAYLRGETSVADRIFAGTELQSIEGVRVALEHNRQVTEDLGAREAAIGRAAQSNPESAQLRLDVEQLSMLLTALTREFNLAQAQIADLHALVAQLRSQQARLIRAIVAEEALVDFEFIVCPRCGQPLTGARADDGQCSLCLQASPPPRDVTAIQAESDRIDEQIADTIQLVESRVAVLDDLRKQITEAEYRRADAGRRLDELTAAYVSDLQAGIARMASERAKAQTEVAKYRQFLLILERSEAAKSRLAQLTEERDLVRRQLEETSARLRVGQVNVAAFEDRFYEYLQRLHIPTFGRPLTAGITPHTYLPVVAGRDFDRLSSQGLQVLVNIAHALAHHTVAIDRNLPLPGLLVIDGPSSNVGTEGYDAERLSDVYSLLDSVARTYAEALQIVVVDNTVPPDRRGWIQLTLSEEDRLIRATHGAGAIESSAA
jgi:hypothetical protein